MPSAPDVIRDGHGRWVHEVGDHRLLTQAEEAALARRIQAGGEDGLAAKQELCLANMRLLLAEARKWQRRGLAYEDLCSAAYIGLNRAAELFDPSMGWRFSTYATFWLRQSVQRALQKTDTISLPDNVKRARLHDAAHPGLSAEELAQAVGRDTGSSDALWALTVRKAAVVSVSLDAETRTDDGEGGNVHEQLVDRDADDPQDVSESRAYAQWIAGMLATLPDQERTVIEAEFGLNGYEGETYTRAEIAADLDLSIEKIDALRKRAFKRLREQAATA